MPAFRALLCSSRAKDASDTDGVRPYLTIWPISESGEGLRMTTGEVMPLARSWTPSSALATPSAQAPFRRATLESSRAPWP
jgi:hypothetical protein